MKLNTENLEYGHVETLSYVNIVEVAIRHGFPKELESEFKEWVEERISNHIEYRRWEDYMGEDL